MEYTALTMAVLNGLGRGVAGEAKRAGNAAAASLSTLASRDALRIHLRLNYLKPARFDDYLDSVGGHLAGAISRGLAPHLAKLELAGDGGTDPAAGWVYRVLENHYRDFARRDRREARRRVRLDRCAAQGAGDDERAEPMDQFESAEPDPLASAADAEVLTGPLGEADLQQLRALDPLNAVLLPVVAGLAPKVPAEVWRELLRRAGVKADVAHAEGEALRRGEPDRDRLARVLGVSIDVVYQRTKRHLARVREMSFVRSLQADYPTRREQAICSATKVFPSAKATRAKKTRRPCAAASLAGAA